MNSGLIAGGSIGAACANSIAAPAWSGQGVLSGQGYQSLGQHVNGVIQQPPTLAEQISATRARAKAKDSVLEYIQAQLNMDLFKGDEFAAACFLRAMTAATQELTKII